MEYVREFAPAPPTAGIIASSVYTAGRRVADIPIEEAVALGIGKQLTNILRDVGEDAQRGRIYLPLDELALFGYTEQDLLNQVVNDNWRALMKFQIQRARKYYQQAESGISRLSPDVRWPVWAAFLLSVRSMDC